LKIGLEVHAAVHVDVVVHFEKHLVRLHAGRLVRQRQPERPLYTLDGGEPVAHADIGEQDSEAVLRPRVPDAMIEECGEILMRILGVVRIVMDKAGERDETVVIARTMADEHLVGQGPGLKIPRTRPHGEARHAGGGQGVGEILIGRRRVVAKAELVMAGQLVRTQARQPSGLDRYVDAGVLRRVEPEAGAEELVAVKALVHLVEAALEVGVGGRTHEAAHRPGRVGIGTVSDVAARQRFRIAAQRVVHETAIERRTGEVVLDIHPAEREVKPAVVDRLLRVDGDEMEGDVASRPIDLLHRQQIVAEGAADVGARAVDDDRMGRETGDAGEPLPIDIGREADLAGEAGSAG